MELQEILDKHGITYYQLGKESGINASTLGKYLRGDRELGKINTINYILLESWLEKKGDQESIEKLRNAVLMTSPVNIRLFL
ncbi:helix-turn-helix domain-containing protein [Culicoidibacter larvae]|uniref:Helix-turn-helix domain-containing protein n=1 Tax=Culicoidibacter larvae TaxID=2579976 RepID=A0A5R8Q7D1_9FIRM|nr:helix-turn-helix domain-containing protein [Culicoidibacter larvae]TLG71357.1 helix-turn-helix domain-containing protein [Culicoidibacter larvae]